MTEPNVAERGLEGVAMKNFTLSNRSCVEDLHKKGGSGGGVLIYVRISAPCVRGNNRITYEEGRLEFCCTRLYPNYTFDQVLKVVGMYRRPDA